MSGSATDQPSPRVSVIVPVRDRRRLLERLLGALDAQRYDDFEVVVVDDGSADGSAELAASATVAGRPVRVVHTDALGAVAARAAGVACARGEILAFTDSDCVPAPSWLAAGVEAMVEGVDLVNGLTRPTRPAGPLERTTGSGEEGLYPTCNLVVRAEAYRAAGGFDVAAGRRMGFRPTRRAQGLGFGEDTLLGWRIARAGRARFAPEAVVEHHVFEPDLRDSLSRALQVGAFPALVREVPELRHTLLHHGWLLGTRSRLPVYALGLAALARRRGLVAATLGWWVALRWRDLRGSGPDGSTQVALLPAEMALDLVWCAALLAGSVRARTLVL